MLSLEYIISTEESGDYEEERSEDEEMESEDDDGEKDGADGGGGDPALVKELIDYIQNEAKKKIELV